MRSEGTWSLDSQRDPRWNKSGRCKGSAFDGPCFAADQWVAQCKEKYGDQPDDLYYSFCKD